MNPLPPELESLLSRGLTLSIQAAKALLDCRHSPEMTALAIAATEVAAPAVAEVGA